MKLFLKNNKKGQEEIPELLIKEHKNRKNSVEKKRINKIKKEKEKELAAKIPVNNNSGFNQLANNNNNDENNLLIDEEILKLWDYLKVTDRYKESFFKKLSFFRENIQEIIIKKEKENLQKVHERIYMVTSAFIERERSIKEFRTLEAILLSRSYMNQSEILYQAKMVINNIKLQNIKLFKSLYELQRIFIYDSIHNKYDMNKIPNNYLFKEDFFIKLQEDVKILYESHLGSKLNIRNYFDPLLLYIDEEDPNDLKGLGEALLWLHNNLIYTNYILPKKYKISKKYVKSNKKINIDAGNLKNLPKPYAHINKYLEQVENYDKTSNDNLKNNAKTKHIPLIEYKKKIDTQKNVNSNNDLNFNNPNNINLNTNNNRLVIDATKPLDSNRKIKKDEKAGLFFYEGKISDLENSYNVFYNEVPENVKITFNLKNDINIYSEGICPMIIIEKEEDKLISFISLQLSNDKENSISINSIGTLRNVQECIQDVINMLSNNKINYHLLLIDLYYKNENNKYDLDKEINLIFKLLKFRWVKLENLEGVRFQKMKYANPEWKNDEGNKKLPIYLFEFKSSLLISTGNKEENNNNKDINYLNEKEINKINLYICENIYSENKEELEKIYKSIVGVDLDEDESIQNIYDKIKQKNLPVYNINDSNITKNYWSYFGFESQNNSMCMVTLGNKNYIRIKKELQYFYDKENEQDYYMFLCSNGNAYIFGNINEKTKNCIFYDYEGNLNNFFKAIYPTLFNEENKELNCLYIPEFDYERNINMNNMNSTIKNIVNVEYSSKLISNKIENIKNFKTIQYDLNPNDIILDKPLFLCGINIYFQNDNPILFCSLIE